MNYTISSSGIYVDTACEPWYSVLASCVGSQQRHQSVHWLLICNDKAQRIFAVQTGSQHGLQVMLNDLLSYRGRYAQTLLYNIWWIQQKNCIIVYFSNVDLLYIVVHLESRKCSCLSPVPHCSAHVGVWKQVTCWQRTADLTVGDKAPLHIVVMNFTCFFFPECLSYCRQYINASSTISKCDVAIQKVGI